MALTDEQIEQFALEPKKASGADGSIERNSLKDLIAWREYEDQQNKTVPIHQQFVRVIYRPPDSLNNNR